VVEELGTFPDYWVTMNEPMVPAIMGNLLGRFPPQRRSVRAYRAVSRAYLRAHAGTYRLIHKVQPLAPDGTRSMVGVAMAYPWIEPWNSPGPAGSYERFAAFIARRTAFEGWDHTIRTGKPHWIHGGPAIAGVQNSYDYCGINYYTRVSLKYDRRRGDQYWIDDTRAPPGVAVTQMAGRSIRRGYIARSAPYGNDSGNRSSSPENGIADDTDKQRPSYIVEHLAQVHRALREGVPILGYYHWSFVDNFEWREGFAKAVRSYRRPTRRPGSHARASPQCVSLLGNRAKERGNEGNSRDLCFPRPSRRSLALERNGLWSSGHHASERTQV